jgi:hypothetical protein
MKLTVNLIAEGKVWPAGSEVPAEIIPERLLCYDAANGDSESGTKAVSGDVVTVNRPAARRIFYRRGSEFVTAEEMEDGDRPSFNEPKYVRKAGRYLRLGKKTV